LKFLFDSNVLLWSFSNRSKLTPRVRQIIDDSQNEFFVSRTSLWELSATVAAGRISMPGNSIQALIDQLETASLPILELENRYILRTETLPYHHSDPFDRILIAQAMEENLTILSSDSKFPLYDAPVIWK
jgi:PIN domain nuclease of toxin-antitoxin system